MGLFERPAAASGGVDRRQLEELRRRTREAPQDVATALAAASALASAGERREAVAVLNRAGSALQKAGKGVEAIAVYRKVDDVDPKSEVTSAFLTRLELKKLLAAASRALPASGPSGPAAPAAPAPAPDPEQEVARAARRVKKERVQAAAAAIPFLKDVPPFLLELVLEKVHLRELALGDVLFREGEAGASLVFVAAGELAAASRGPSGETVPLGRLGPGSVLGEISFLSGVPRTATLTATEPCELLELERGAVDAVLRKNRGLAGALSILYRERVLDGVLARSVLFAGLPREERDLFASRFAPVEARAGSEIVVQGRTDDAIFLLRRGQVRVSVERGGKEVGLALLSPPEIFGDWAALRGTARTATVTAVTPVELLRLSRADLLELVERNPPVRAALEEVQLQRFVATAEALGGS